MDRSSETKLAAVAPELAARVRAMAATLAARGITIRVVSGLRSTAEQARLYASRASNPRPVAAPGTSLHEFGRAVDVAIVGRGTWPEVGAAGEAAGLRWGGRFNRVDLVHFELATGAQAAPAPTQAEAVTDMRAFNSGAPSSMPGWVLPAVIGLLIVHLVRR
jgi:peptidoglycan L-alanyl-D-glutamate endopeptidase CwlK